MNKRIFTFEVNKESEIDDVVISTDATGAEVKTITKIKKQIPHKFFIKKPNRSLRDEMELFYNVNINEGIKAGLLAHVQLAKRLDNDDGILSEKDKKYILDLYKSGLELEEKYQKLNIKKAEELTEEEKVELEKVKTEMVNTRRQIYNFETNHGDIFNSTAEVYARNKTIIWLLLFLSYQDNNGESCLFGDGSYKEKLTKYDEFDEKEDLFHLEVIGKFLFILTFWYFNRDVTEADLNKALTDFK